LTDHVEQSGVACRDVNILVNNAGNIPLGGLEDLDGVSWRKFCALTQIPSLAQGQTAGNFYSGARNISRGNPVLVPQNMTGAGGLVMAN